MVRVGLVDDSSIYVPFAFNSPKKREVKSKGRQAYKRDKHGPQQRTEVVKNKATHTTKSAGHVAEAA